MRIAFVAAVMGGGGHISRALSFRRAVDRGRLPVDYRAFGPPHGLAADTSAFYTPVDGEVARVPRTPADAEDAALTRALIGFRPDLVLVDVYWSPVRFLRATLGVPVWLLVRAVPRAWFVGPPAARFRPGDWDRVVAIEPLPHHALADRVEPVVTTTPDELLPRDAARRRWGVDPDTHLTLVAQTGMQAELARLARERPASSVPERVIEVTLRDPAAPFPLAPWLAGADTLLGGAGYNLFWETRALGLADRTRLTPFVRGSDDQAWRLAHCADLHPAGNGADTLLQQALRL